MALDDPSINKVIYREYNKPKLVKTERDKKAKLACVMIEVGRKPHVEIIECAPGEYHITCRKRDLPRKIWFETKCLESYLKEPKKVGRYD